MMGLYRAINNCPPLMEIEDDGYFVQHGGAPIARAVPRPSGDLL